jgi:hypothetical protein
MQERCASRKIRAKLSQPALPFLLESAFANHVAALPVIAAVQQHHKLAGTHIAKGSLWVARAFGETEPEHIDRRAEIHHFQVCAFAHRRTASVCADHEICVHFEFALRRGCSHADDPLIFKKQVGHLDFRSQTKRRAAPRMFGNEIQKIPLRHEGDEFAVRRQMRKIRDSRFFGAEVHVNLPHLLMRLAQELFEQTEFVH